MTERGNKFVLVVDDDENIRRLLCSIFKIAGYHVVAAEGGRAALQQVATPGAQIDLVVLDMVMPEMNGTQTHAALRALQPSLPFLLISGECEDGQVQTLLQKGRSAFLAKPFTPKLLLGAAEQLLRNCSNR